MEEEYGGLIKIMEDTPSIQPPDDFTGRVMSRIPAYSRGVWWRIWESLSQPRESGLLDVFVGVPTLKECSFYFFMAGFFNLIMGTVLIAGLKRLGVEICGANWIMLQPQIAFMTATGFIALGILLPRENLFVIRASNVAIFIYMGFVIINGVAIQMTYRSPVVLAVTLHFMGCGLFVGTLLATIIQRYLKNLNEAKV